MEIHIELICDLEAAAPFFSLFQEGVLLPIGPGATIQEFLCSRMGVPQTYLDERLNTIFLDGRPVDDPGTANLRPGSVLALSTSMPGFAGAVLRKGGYYAGMRDSITHREDGVGSGEREGLVTVKLFNMTLAELAPLFLARGVGIGGDRLEEFFASRPSPFWKGITEARLDGEEVPTEELSRRRWGEMKEPVGIRVTVS